VWVQGRRVEDVTSDSVLGPFAHAFAEIFDLQHDPAYRDALTFPSPSSGEPVGLGYRFPRSTEDLVRQRQLFELIDRRCGGVLGRFPQHMAVVVLGLYSIRHMLEGADPRYPGNVERYLEHCREHDLALATGFTDPQLDRGVDQSKMHYFHVVERRADGVIVRGAKGVATVAPYADEYFGLVSPRPDLLAEQILYFSLPMATEGMKIVCRESFAQVGVSDHPLSARYDEMDAWILFEDVFVPNERIFFTERVDLNTPIFSEIPAAWGYYSTLIRAAVKVEALAGICFAVTDYLGTRRAPQVEPLLAEVVTHLETLRAFIRAAEEHPIINREGLALPDHDQIALGRLVALEQHERMLNITRELCGASILMAPGQDELEHPDIGPALRRYLQGGDERAPERFKMMKLAWDFTSGSFASRQLLFELHNSGSLAANRSRFAGGYDVEPLIGLAKQLAGIVD